MLISLNTVTVPDSTSSRLKCVLDKRRVLDFLRSELDTGFVTFPSEDTVRFFFHDGTFDFTFAEIESLTFNDDTVSFEVTLRPSEAA